MFLFFHGAIYKQALQAPKEDPFNQWKDDLEDYEDRANILSAEIFAVLFDEPMDLIAILEELLSEVEKMYTLHDVEALDEWAGDFGRVGVELIDVSETAKEVLQEVSVDLERMAGWREYLADGYNKTNDKRYIDLYEIVETIVDEITQTQAQYEG